MWSDRILRFFDAARAKLFFTRVIFDEGFTKQFFYGYRHVLERTRITVKKDTEWKKTDL